MKHSAEREARSEHPPADVEEAARRALEILRAMKGKPIPIRFPSDEVAEQFNILIKAIGPVATAYLSERTRREKMEEALRNLESANEALAARRPQGVYDALVAAGQQDLLHDLDVARTAARASLESPQ